MGRTYSARRQSDIRHRLDTALRQMQERADAPTPAAPEPPGVRVLAGELAPLDGRHAMDVAAAVAVRERR